MVSIKKEEMQREFQEIEVPKTLGEPFFAARKVAFYSIKCRNCMHGAGEVVA